MMPSGINEAVTAMNGTITTRLKDKGFGFITDENSDNRYCHEIQFAKPAPVKKYVRADRQQNR